MILYNDSIIEHMAAKYQYVLKAPLETETKDVEKYFMSTVEKTSENGEKMIYQYMGYRMTVNIYQ